MEARDIYSARGYTWDKYVSRARVLLKEGKTVVKENDNKQETRFSCGVTRTGCSRQPVVGFRQLQSRVVFRDGKTSRLEFNRGCSSEECNSESLQPRATNGFRSCAF